MVIIMAMLELISATLLFNKILAVLEAVFIWAFNFQKAMAGGRGGRIVVCDSPVR